MLQLLKKIRALSLLKDRFVSESTCYRFQLMVNKGQHCTLPVHFESQLRCKGDVEAQNVGKWWHSDSSSGQSWR